MQVRQRYLEERVLRELYTQKQAMRRQTLIAGEHRKQAPHLWDPVVCETMESVTVFE